MKMSVETQSITPRTVLLIDDVPMNIRRYTKLLQPLGIKLMVANNLFEACVLLQYHLPQTIIFNHETIMDEYASFLSLFKDNPLLEQIMLIAIIRDDDMTIRQQIAQSECDHFLGSNQIKNSTLLPDTIDKALRLC